MHRSSYYGRGAAEGHSQAATAEEEAQAQAQGQRFSCCALFEILQDKHRCTRPFPQLASARLSTNAKRVGLNTLLKYCERKGSRTHCTAMATGSQLAPDQVRVRCLSEMNTCSGGSNAYESHCLSLCTLQ